MQHINILELIQDFRRKCLDSDLTMLENLEITQAEYQFFIASLSVPQLQIAAIGKKMAISPSRLSRIIESMVQHQLLERSPSKEDRRAIQIAFSPKGKDILDQIIAHRKQCEAKIHSSMTDEMKQRLADDLRFLIDKI